MMSARAAKSRLNLQDTDRKIGSMPMITQIIILYTDAAVLGEYITPCWAFLFCGISKTMANVGKKVLKRE